MIQLYGARFRTNQVSPCAGLSRNSIQVTDKMSNHSLQLNRASSLVKTQGYRPETLKNPPLASSQELREQIVAENKNTQREKCLVVAQRNILKGEEKDLT